MNKIYQKSFLGVKNAGFTLIELLVVVLIIGILAAVALPQYEKAVLKSRVSTVLPWYKLFREGRRQYILAANPSVTLQDFRLITSARGNDLPGEVTCGGTNANGDCTNSSTLKMPNGNTFQWNNNEINIIFRNGTSSITLSMAFTNPGPGQENEALYCIPNGDWGEKMCRMLTPGQQKVMCRLSRECYKMNL